ncbi:MAG: bifunctional demethylmenaquinone methyltransferase/2-methoxy-6-polyprenyl-1,4-benzoquinol methylase UbiE [Phycisphaerae bacterium]|nr:bifunctional demethylmenaquinone methyltransferase/2-methoxy-6-polyprenyl-1,4-benzoquinol methylase UbiE [Phycisphaerae bacterium]
MRKKPGQLAWDKPQLQRPHEQRDKALRVRHMFDGVASRYELVNRVFSAGRDAAWRRKAVELAAAGADDAVLDVACGTGDFLRAFAAIANPPWRLVGCDFSHGMLREAISTSPNRQFHWIEADALLLPLAPELFTVASCAFGVRNFQDLDAGLREMWRVLKVNGRIVILEFTRPENRLFRLLYEFYANRFMPWAATWVSGDRTGAYRYLPRSVVSFIGAAEMCRRLQEAGFGNVIAARMSLGIVTIYVGTKQSTAHG